MQKEEVLFKTHYNGLCHFAWKIVGDLSVAEDLVQDSFISYFKNTDQVSDNEIAIKNYLYTAVRFACYNHIRHEKVRQKYWNIVGFTEEDNIALELNMIHSEVIQEIYKIIEQMPSSCQQVFRLGYLEGLSNLEITRELQISINTVKTQKQRGMKMLLKRLNPEFIPFIIFLLKNI
ncbi:RNA polymerase sigma-70 factor [Sphingobacterium sp. InxBP1]|uniref:RNA polymerase sigma-70 factor n=1 Tax=Sphingobacterium sp. InxBP1 TaxID=2870328 RepID=UPI00224452C4|nr:RNA polymerase sigma-70 factor [Sphingobacterium sp. InxBP1]MCW8312169.1 RNA polymerase sigma-70 factor [Sphingobacterium sp. InxBP1]